MRVPFYDIKAQYDELAAPLDKVVHEVISSGVYALGPHHNALEREIAELHGCKHGIALNSGTDALRIMMDAQGIGPGDEVITTAFTFVASTETIVQTGATPVFVDVDPSTFMIDTSLIDAAVTERTKAILPIHLFGQLCDVRGVTAAAERNSLVVLEDAAQAIGCTYEGTPSGNFGVAAGFSFYVTKNLGAAGDAGMIVTNDDEYAARARAIRIHGMGRERYYYDYVGYTSRMDEIQAAVLRVKLQRMAAWNERRAEIAAIYLDRLSGLDLPLPSIQPGNNHTWHQFAVTTPRRNELMPFLRERQVDSMIYYPVPLHFHAPYARFGGGEGSLPETERISREVLNLPIHPHLTDEQVEHVARSVVDFFA
ncbi:DegT/DnrJ/EryC1/StrS family aminotransferase [Fimbriimonas ginsengisoli]|uniref:Pleiotropic regulatory protein DegT n=1 Tax=Fimbriimonas ginsengisoli Gsoil 348 TaxID=661478 RepID=A0A068NPB8_FIMGI|nr:DegT/DnrJ/EryC1/StrS family aminotransferase [Fimbriimonas ginsengisoli]AIE85217.1 pleiotropic regulatory protein DegT [Fimbriimonas ginsengisoli Gsoil 348]